MASVNPAPKHGGTASDRVWRPPAAFADADSCGSMRHATAGSGRSRFAIQAVPVGLL
jgi:hypothetical protein